MSKEINNKEYRQKKLKELILELHDGKTVEDVQASFAELIDGIAASEISEMEQALMAEGMPVSEIQRLCDVHAAVFKGSIEEIHAVTGLENIPGHPINTFYLENRAIEDLIFYDMKEHLEMLDKELLTKDIDKLMKIDNHYARKENLIFPYMEKHDITAPPKVMWGVDDEIRDALKQVKSKLNDNEIINNEVANEIDEVTQKIKEMIFKEESIMFPMILDVFTPQEWLQIYNGSDEIGYTLYEPRIKWQQADNVDDSIQEETKHDDKNAQGFVKFDAGFMMPEEINAVLNTLPLDITFVDAKGHVQYFSQGEERIFPRPKTIIGREVKNCHPPASVHIVEKIMDDFKTGVKDNEDFWIKMGGKFVYIRYYAVRNDKNEYLGTLEVTQNITNIVELEGEKRLMS